MWTSKIKSPTLIRLKEDHDEWGDKGSFCKGSTWWVNKRPTRNYGIWFYNNQKDCDGDKSTIGWLADNHVEKEFELAQNFENLKLDL